MSLYFTRDEILMGREVDNPLTPKQEQNLTDLIVALSKVRLAYGQALFISSGYRPPLTNQSVDGAKQSAHMDCQAADIIDEDGYFANWCLNNLTILEEVGIFMEDPRYTMFVNENGEWVSGWVHLQTRPTGRRIFIPYEGDIKMEVV